MSVLDRLAKRFGTKTDAAIRREIERLTDERRSYMRAMPPQRETAHARVDELQTDAKAALEAHILGMGYQVPPLESDHPSLAQLARLYALSRPELGEQMHRVIDKAPGYAEISQADYAKKVETWESQIAERELELKRRHRAAEAEAARAALEALEEGGAD